MSITVILLAAGRGSRMRTQQPKVLHPLAGKPLILHILDQLSQLPPMPIIGVCGYAGEAVITATTDTPIQWVWQTQQNGTGHAVLQALPNLSTDQVLILNGDIPCLPARTLNQLMLTTPPQGIGLVTAQLANPTGYGRICRNAEGAISGIVEESDTTLDQRAITEINVGAYLAPVELLNSLLPKLDANNAAAEYYLTDVVQHALLQHLPVNSVEVEHAWHGQGINTQAELTQLEAHWRAHQADLLLQQGVKLYDPMRLDVRGDIEVGLDVEIDINVILEGRVQLGHGVKVGPGCVLRDCSIGDGSLIHAHSVLEGATLGANCVVGPFARLRPDTQLADTVKVGNFVEIKKSTLGPGSKVNHLSYLGDARVGTGVNIGAGTITCNYNGQEKFPTFIDDGAFIGSNCELIAPVRVGAGATIGAGTTLTRDAPARALTINCKQLATQPGWQPAPKNAKTSVSST